MRLRSARWLSYDPQLVRAATASARLVHSRERERVAVLRRDGESEVRLAQLAAWEESPFFDERECAALALTDAVTQVSATHVPDAVWARAEAHFPPEELAHLLFAIAAINLWNRLAVSTRGVPASYAEAPA